MSIETEWVDPDDAPEVGAEWFAKADHYRNDVLVKRGRGRPPQGDSAKVQQSLRLSPDVLSYFRSTGAGWQARIDDVLREHVRQDRSVSASQGKRA